ncbi:MAG: hypothetical protein ABSA34_03055, partial [Candidatus Goldiibacteriota bacterium]
LQGISHTSQIESSYKAPLRGALLIGAFSEAGLAARLQSVKTGAEVYMLYNYQDQCMLTVRVYSLDGTQALSVNYSVIGKGRIEVDASQLAPGVYYYTVEAVHSGTTDNTKVKKLLVSR